MVLDLGDDDLVAFTDRVLPAARIAQHEGHFVERLGGVLGEGDLLVHRADEAGDGLAGGFVGVGGFLGDLVGATVDRGVVLGEERPLGVEDLQRPLRGRPGIQVHEWTTVTHGAGQDREICPDGCGVQCAHRAIRPLR